MKREQALLELQKYITNKNLLKHMIASEAVMARLAQHFGADEVEWSMAGLMHDIDYDQTKDKPEIHSQVGAEILQGLGFSDEVIYAVKVHNSRHGLPRLSLMDKALYATDPMTGLIVAGALIRPEKKLAAVSVDFLYNRFYEKSFAKGANREQIAACSELGMDLEEFLELGLEAMQGIAADLEL